MKRVLTPDVQALFFRRRHSRAGHLPRSVRRMLKRRPSLLLATYEVLGFRGIKPGASLRLAARTPDRRFRRF